MLEKASGWASRSAKYSRQDAISKSRKRTNSVRGSLYVGHEEGSEGTYELSGTGSLSASREYVGYEGTGRSAGINRHGIEDESALRGRP